MHVVGTEMDIIDDPLRYFDCFLLILLRGAKGCLPSWLVTPAAPLRS